MLVIAAPGQGAQTPGFLVPWLELPGFADRLSA
jgi:[acyl-carrier-protein] S-malonyltransferase